MKLLTREQFFEAVMKRDRQCCVYCLKPAVDAHHLIDRKCFDDGGYYKDNGVSLCSQCHLYAERGVLSPQKLRSYAGIKEVVLPKNLDSNLEYDKWGEEIDTDATAVDQCFMPIQSLGIIPDMFQEVLAQFVIDYGLTNDFIEYAKEWVRNPSIVYDPLYGDNKLCICGHAYDRHFDSHDNMFPLGCKYCNCDKFIAHA